jgi:hypothetical protein
MSDSLEDVERIIHAREVASSGEHSHFAVNDKKRYFARAVAEMFPSVKGCPVADSARVKR